MAEFLSTEFCYESSKLLSFGADGNVCVYDVLKGYEPVQMIASHFPITDFTPSQRLSASSAGPLFAVVSAGGTSVIVYNVLSLSPVVSIPASSPQCTITHIVLSDDGKEITLVTSNRRISKHRLLNDPDSAKLVCEMFVLR